jgi:hypothetical protein
MAGGVVCHCLVADGATAGKRVVEGRWLSARLWFAGNEKRERVGLLRRLPGNETPP